MEIYRYTVLDRTYHNQMEPSLRDGNPVSGWHAESYPTGRAPGVHKTGPGLTTTACLILVGSTARHGPHPPLRKLASIRLHDSKMDSIHPPVLSVLWTRQVSTSIPGASYPCVLITVNYSCLPERWFGRHDLQGKIEWDMNGTFESRLYQLALL